MDIYTYVDINMYVYLQKIYTEPNYIQLGIG